MKKTAPVKLRYKSVKIWKHQDASTGLNDGKNKTYNSECTVFEEEILLTSPGTQVMKNLRKLNFWRVNKNACKSRGL